MSNLSNNDIYINVTVSNDSETRIIPAEYIEERSQPIVMNPSEYKMSVVRFDIPATAIKKFRYQNNFLLTLVFPALSLQSQQTMVLVQTDYAQGGNPNDVWSFNQIVQSANNAYATAFADIVTQYEVINGPGSWVTDPGSRPQNPPFFYFDVDTKLFSIYCPVDMADSNVNRIEMWFNDNFYRLFATFYTEYYGTGLASGLDTRLKIYDTFLDTETISAVDYYKVEQEYETTTLWFDTYKIALVSHSMPVRKEYVAANIGDLDTGGNTVQLGVVADFDYTFDSANISRITYIPSAEFRWIDLLTTQPLKKVDIEIFLVGTDGRLQPGLLQPGQTFNCKLLFRRKSREEIDAMHSHPSHIRM